jgi:hypothetical protein
MLWEAGQDSARPSHSLLVALTAELAAERPPGAGAGGEL